MDNKIFDLADRLKAAKDKKKELDAMIKEVGAEIERLDLELSDAMTDDKCGLSAHGEGKYPGFEYQEGCRNEYG